LPSISLRV
jgi:hypothetical protein